MLTCKEEVVMFMQQGPVKSYKGLPVILDDLGAILLSSLDSG